MASLRQDMVVSGRQQAQLKRWMQLQLTTDSGDTGSDERKWTLKLQGKLMNGMSQEELEAGATTHLTSYFERIKIEFADDTYETVEWVKSTDKAGSNYDALEIARPFNSDKKVSGTMLLTQLHHPKRFRLSPVLQKILGFEVETRTSIVGALWQYIKSNRLQETYEQALSNPAETNYQQPIPMGANLQEQQSGRQRINANSELLRVFGQESVQFHQIMAKLSEHLFELEPLKIEFEIDPTA